MLTLFRGDDLAFAEFDRKVCVRFNTCLDLTGWGAKFCLFDDIKMTADISSHIWTFGYTAEETQVFPLGKTFGKLFVMDSTGQVRQVSKVEVEVVNQKLEPCIAGTIAVSVDNVVADYRNMGNKPVLNGKVVEGIHDSAYYGVASAEDVADYKGLADTVEMMSATVTDQGEAIAHNYLKLVALKEQVDKIDPTDYSSQIAALNSRIASEETTRATADTELAARIEAEKTAREDAVATATSEMYDTVIEAMAAERVAREEAIVAIADGTTPISKLLFVAEGDPENFYRIQVVMRDDGAGGLLPALALDAVPREESSSDESSTS